MMKNVVPKFLRIWILFFLIGHSLFAQKHFNVILNLPQGIHKEKLEVRLEDGRRIEKIQPNPTGINQLTLRGEYSTIYAVISIEYPPDETIKGFANTFFVQENQSVITFHQSDSLNFPFMNYSLENAMDFKEDKRRMEEYVAVERKKEMDYESQFADQIFNEPDTAIRNYYFNVLRKDLGKKESEYILNNPGSYYSFYIFKLDVAGHAVLSSDSLLLIFNAFPNEYKYSDEGNYLHQEMNGKLSVKKGDPCIDFDAKDINSKHIALSQFKGKKYVLLHFWATWCTPCMRELPALTEINNRYQSKDLQIISIALKSANYADYTRTIRKYHMEWIHIYNNLDLLNKYGNMAISRVCLIDKDGKLIYDSAGSPKNYDIELSELNQILKKTIK